MAPNNWLNFLNLDSPEAINFGGVNGSGMIFGQQQQQEGMGSSNGMNNMETGNNNNSLLAAPEFDLSSASSFLSDDLRRQLDAWTNVSFWDESAAQMHGPNGNATDGVIPSFDASLPAHSDLSGASTGLFAPLACSNTTKEQQQLYAADDLNNSSKPDPSPYAKRPFGNFGSKYHANLDRDLDASQDAKAQLKQAQINVQAAHVAESPINTNWQNLPVFDFTKDLFAGSTHPSPVTAYNSTPKPEKHSPVGLASAANTPDRNTDVVPPPPAKRQRKSATAATASQANSVAPSPQVAHLNNTNTPSSASPSSSASVDKPKSANGSSKSGSAVPSIVDKQPLLTKAAILAKQLEDLQKKAARTPEEEAARLAEVSRIAQEDDKRRRNTEASARFRVKKKAREAALEDTVNELKVKMDGLEKELSKTKNENAFLRDLVIRKIGLADISASNPYSNQPPASPNTREVTGVGTL